MLFIQEKIMLGIMLIGAGAGLAVLSMLITSLLEWKFNSWWFRIGGPIVFTLSFCLIVAGIVIGLLEG